MPLGPVGRWRGCPWGLVVQAVMQGSRDYGGDVLSDVRVRQMRFREQVLHADTAASVSGHASSNARKSQPISYSLVPSVLVPSSIAR